MRKTCIYIGLAMLTVAAAIATVVVIYTNEANEVSQLIKNKNKNIFLNLKDNVSG